MFNSLFRDNVAIEDVLTITKLITFIRAQDDDWKSLVPKTQSLFDEYTKSNPENRLYFLSEIIYSITGLFMSTTEKITSDKKAMIVDICSSITKGMNVESDFIKEQIDFSIYILTMKLVDFEGESESFNAKEIVMKLKNSEKSILTTVLSHLMLVRYIKLPIGSWDQGIIDILVDLLSDSYVSDIEAASMAFFAQ